MDLNELIHKRLSSYEDLKGILASFAGEPAIFNTEKGSTQEYATR